MIQLIRIVLMMLLIVCVLPLNAHQATPEITLELDLLWLEKLVADISTQEVPKEQAEIQLPEQSGVFDYAYNQTTPLLRYKSQLIDIEEAYSGGWESIQVVLLGKQSLSPLFIALQFMEAVSVFSLESAQQHGCQPAGEKILVCPVSSQGLHLSLPERLNWGEGFVYLTNGQVVPKKWLSNKKVLTQPDSDLAIVRSIGKDSQLLGRYERWYSSGFDYRVFGAERVIQVSMILGAGKRRDDDEDKRRRLGRDNSLPDHYDEPFDWEQIFIQPDQNRKIKKAYLTSQLDTEAGRAAFAESNPGMSLNDVNHWYRLRRGYSVSGFGKADKKKYGRQRFNPVGGRYCRSLSLNGDCLPSVVSPVGFNVMGVVFPAAFEGVADVPLTNQPTSQQDQTQMSGSPPEGAQMEPQSDGSEVFAEEALGENNGLDEDVNDLDEPDSEDDDPDNITEDVIEFPDEETAREWDEKEALRLMGKMKMGKQ